MLHNTCPNATNKKLFVTDLDGTILDDKKEISQEIKEQIERYLHTGGLFTVATGRTEDTCRLATDNLPISIPVILYNGASVMDLETRKVMYERTLSAKQFRPIVQKLMDTFPKVCVEIFAYGPLILVNPKAVMDPYIIRENHDYVCMDLEDTPETWLKIMLSAPNATLLKVAEFLKELLTDETPCATTFSAEYYYEILNADCSKAKATQWLAQWLHVDRSNVGAIGDHLNDEELLLWCGHPYTPANAYGSVKKVAHVTKRTNNEGAVLEAMQDFMEK